jgi:phospholipid-binding lipoprotein MlaA
MIDIGRGDDAAKPLRWLAGMKAVPMTLAGLGALLLAGCATAPPSSDPEAVAEFNATNDPIEPFNRAVFDFNLALDDYVLSPVARGYRWLFPAYVRERVTNFMANLGEPVTFGNDLFQGEFSRAGQTLVRFASNSTVGLGGLYDPAKVWGIDRHEEDFGQTLGTYGTPEGPYLVLPFFGPAPPRDAFGRAVDMVIDPSTWVGGDNALIAGWSATGVNIINSRANNLETIDDLRKTSLDFYAAVRSLYRQNRAAEISNGNATPAAPGYGGSSSNAPVAPATGNVVGLESSPAFTLAMPADAAVTPASAPTTGAAVQPNP